MKPKDFDYDLPKELIAQTPLEPRDRSRLMVLNRDSNTIQHKRFFELVHYLRPGDVLVFNESRVMRARLHGFRIPSGGKMELLLLKKLSNRHWQVLIRPGNRMQIGSCFEIKKDGHLIKGEVTKIHDDGSRTVQFSDEKHLSELGSIPLPPYIRERLDDPERYQTVYSKIMGSVASPTAGLHFTSKLIDQIQKMGVELVFVTLHVGWDSFRTIESDDITSHKMHSEYWHLGENQACVINKAKADGRRVVCVGTTTTRLIEHAATINKNQTGIVSAGSGWTSLFIYPGYRFRIVDVLLTNFHLPKSSLLMLTTAFGGHKLTSRAYSEATHKRYRFYSFGDAMLIT